MSFFKKMKEMFTPKDYETMTHNELLSLNDAELSGAISDRIFSRADVLNVEKMMTTLEGAKKTYYIIYL